MTSVIYKTQDTNVDDVNNLLSSFIEESIFNSEPDRIKIVHTIHHPDVYTIVAYEDEKPIGLFIGTYYEHILFKGKMATDLVVYVAKERRGSMISLRFLKMFEEWLRDKDVKYIMLGQSTGIGDVDRVCKFYEKLGYTMTGFNTVKEF